MASNFIIGKNHVFTNRTPDSEPYIYLKPGQGESLVVNGDITGNAATATYAASSGSAAGSAESISFSSLDPSVTITSVGTVSNTGPTGTAYKGCSVAIDDNQLFIGAPGDTRNSKLGTLSYYTKSAGVWTLNSSITPPAVLPGCLGVYSYWGYSISCKGSLMCTSSPWSGPLGTETGVAVYRKVAGTWTHQSSTSIGGTQCHTDGTNLAGWLAVPGSNDVDIGAIDGTLVRTITTTADINDCWVHNGEVAVASSTGILEIFNIGTGALVRTYSGDGVFGHLVSMTTDYIASVGTDQLSLVVIDRADHGYFFSIKLEESIKNIKLEGNSLMICTDSSIFFYYNNGSIFFYTNSYAACSRSDDTSPFASSTNWPKIADFDSTTGSFAFGIPLSGSGVVQMYDYSEAAKETDYGSLMFVDNKLGAFIKERPFVVQDDSINPLDAGTATLYAKGIGSEKVYTGLAKITNSTSSTSTSTGALICTGGVGCGGSIYASDLRAVSTTEASSVTTGSIQTLGGLGVSKRLYTTDLTCLNSMVGRNSYCSVVANLTTSVPDMTNTNPIQNTVSVYNSSSTITGTTGGVITVNESGIYVMQATVSFQTNTSGYRIIIIRPSVAWNGLTDLGSQRCAPIDAPLYMTTCQVAYLAAGTTLTVLAYQTSGSSLNCNGNMTVCKIAN